MIYHPGGVLYRVNTHPEKRELALKLKDIGADIRGHTREGSIVSAVSDKPTGYCILSS